MVILIAILFWIVVGAIVGVVKRVSGVHEQAASTGVVHPRIDGRLGVPLQTLPSTIPMDVRGNAVCGSGRCFPMPQSFSSTSYSYHTGTADTPVRTTPVSRMPATYTWENMHLNDSLAMEAACRLNASSSVTVKLGFRRIEDAVEGLRRGYEIHYGQAWYTEEHSCTASDVLDSKYCVEMKLWGGSLKSPANYRLYKYSTYDMDVGDAIILEISCT